MIGETISHYRILEEIGKGGMGTVYKAEDLKLKRTVAIKFLRFDLILDPEAKKRFFQEAQTASFLDHPNICTIYDIDETDEGNVFIVMAFYKGEPLRNKIDRGTLEMEEVIDFAIQVGSALATAHAANIIHRDIKPDNIMITDKNQVKIVDFGLAKLVDQARITKEGVTLGTITYMSPEQTKSAQVDHRSDIWAFGVVLYEMLTGHCPFKGDYEQATIYSILNEKPEEVSKFRPNVPGELEKIVYKILEKSPDQRYQHIDDCIVDLRRLKKNLERQQTYNVLVENIKDEKRKLAAIMFTDMVGYSTLTHKNESLALELLEEHRRILRSFFPNYGGVEVETAGDAFFVEFSSALEAVRCAVDIQKNLYQRNQMVAEEKWIKIRIGVDVVHDGKNVLGDGVNIAARIEPLAHSCGICVSQDVARQIQNKLDLPLQKIDTGQLKNIKLPVDIYAVVLPWLEKELSRATKISFRNHWRKMIAISLLLILTFWIYFSWPIFMNDSVDKNSIAVLPFKNLSDMIENEYFSEGITEEIIAHLSKFGDLRVISRTSAMQYKNTEKNVKDIGEELNVAKILEGSVRRDKNNVRIVAQLIDAQTDTYLWTETYDENLTKIFEIQSAVAEKIAKSLKMKISRVEKEQLGKKATNSLEAYDLYLKGRYHLNKRMPDDLNKGITYFEKALEIDPKYASAYSGLADSYMMLGNYDVLMPRKAFKRAKEAAKEALEIDPMLAEAHSSLAFVSMHYDLNWQEAEREFKKAMELDPGYPMAYCFYASYLTALKRFEDAKKYMKNARELDPLSTAILLEEGLDLYFERDYDQTIIQCQKILQMDPLLILAYIPLAGAYIQKSNYNEALKILSRASLFSKGNPVIVAAIGYTYALAGRQEDAHNMVELLIEKSEEEYVSPFWMAVVYVGLNNYKQAMLWLERAYEDRDGAIIYLDVIPIFDPLRSDQRFINLLKKIGFNSNNISYLKGKNPS
jgi:serine/threonine protein kinase/TolB-like protein/Flp pilus assembly protein TadD